ncbi:hypothetical protein [Frondihabitans australicus]|uniref:Pilus assembly protein PilO n=1 Tax=Frondihabitans australicus TaxID=386892 RepID=A0A495IJQ8_9MICO|nr:hypothetical protein [Frondihabitans australicus]RKR75521.1 hypothetical protein C8E83_2669 [Frondihabitans australicus]
MDRNRLLTIAAALAAVVVIAGGFFLGIQPKLSAASTAHAQEQSVTTQNESLDTNLAKLKSQFEKIDSLRAQLASKREAVPSDVASDTFITELNGIADSTNVTVSNITFGTPAAYAAPVSSTPAASTTSTATASASASPSASATATAAPTPTATTPQAPTVATSPLITAANFTDIPVSMEIKGSYTQAIAYLQGLRDGKRLFLVTSITVTPAGSDGTTSSAPTWTFGGLIYALTDSTSATQEQQSTTSSTASGTASDSSTTDSAAGK